MFRISASQALRASLNSTHAPTRAGLPAAATPRDLHLQQHKRGASGGGGGAGTMTSSSGAAPGAAVAAIGAAAAAAGGGDDVWAAQVQTLRTKLEDTTSVLSEKRDQLRKRDAELAALKAK